MNIIGGFWHHLRLTGTRALEGTVFTATVLDYILLDHLWDLVVFFCFFFINPRGIRTVRLLFAGSIRTLLKVLLDGTVFCDISAS